MPAALYLCVKLLFCEPSNGSFCELLSRVSRDESPLEPRADRVQSLGHIGRFTAFHIFHDSHINVYRPFPLLPFFFLLPIHEVPLPKTNLLLNSLGVWHRHRVSGLGRWFPEVTDRGRRHVRVRTGRRSLHSFSNPGIFPSGFFLDISDDYHAFLLF